MKKFLVLFAASALFCFKSSALPIAWEPFNYPLTPTNLIGQVNPNGNGFTWYQAGPSAVATNVPSINPGNLSYPGLAPSTGNSIRFGGINGTGLGARFSEASSALATSGTLYYSFIFQLVDTNGLSTSAFFWAGFNNSTGSQSTTPTVVGTRISCRPANGGTNFQIGLDKSSGSTPLIQFATNLFTTNDVIFIVGSYTFNTSTTTDDVSQLWINPDSSTFGTTNVPPATLTNTSGTDLAQIASLCIFNRNAGEPHGIILDQLAIATSWDQVTATNIPLAITAQPTPQRAIAGGHVTFNVSTFNAATYQWMFNGVAIPGATQNSLTLTNIQLSQAGNYSVGVGNPPATPLLSSNASLTVIPDTFPRLEPLFSLAPGTRPYLTTDGSTTPNERCIAYNSLSNQVLLVSRTNTMFNYITNAGVYVLDGDTGADLYGMNTNNISGGIDINGGGTNLITLNCIDVGPDGAVYACNVGQTNSSPNWFQLYYWPDSDPTTAPVAVFQGDPGGQTTALRFGDSMAVRGSGASTQVLLDNSTGVAGSILTPGAEPINTFQSWNFNYFTNVATGTSGGRTLLFYGSDTSFWEKHGGGGGTGGGLALVSYDLEVGAQNSTIVTNYPNLPGGPNLVAFNAQTNILVAINNSGSSTSPNTVDLYDYSNPTEPLFITSYNFPVNQQPNGNGCGRIIFSGDRVYALDSNNGLVAFRLVPVLHIATDGAGNAILSWSADTPGYTLMAGSSLQTPNTWTSLGTGAQVGNQYFVTNAISAGDLFYQLKK